MKTNGGIYDGREMPDRSFKGLDQIDAMPPKLRACVHEFGTEIVNAFLSVGIDNPGLIRTIVHNVWTGPRSPAQGVQSESGRRRGTPVAHHLDWLLMQAGASITATALVAFLARHGLVIVQRDPPPYVVQASMDEVSSHTERVTKEQKHRRRLCAAINASVERLWPSLDQQHAAAIAKDARA